MRNKHAVSMVAMAFLPVAALAQTNVDDALAAAIRSAKLEGRIYKAITNKDKPADVRLGQVFLKGKLTGLSIKYELPSGGLPLVPAVGDQQTIENCSSETVTNAVELNSSAEVSSSWSTSTSLTAGFEQSIEVSAEFNTPFGGAGATSTSTFSIEKTLDQELGGSKTESRGYTQSKTINTPPNKYTVTQLVYSQQTASGIPYVAKFLVSGNTEVSFVRDGDVSQAAIRPHSADNACLGRTPVALPGMHFFIQQIDCGGAIQDLQRWTLSKAGELKLKGGECLDAAGGKGNHGDPVIAYKCNDGPNQKWQINEDGTITGMNKRCLTLDTRNPLQPVLLKNCDGSDSQKWRVDGRGEAARGTVAIDKYLSEDGRTLEVKGSFKGSFASNSSSFSAVDKDLSKTYCDKVRAETFGDDPKFASAGAKPGAAAAKIPGLKSGGAAGSVAAKPGVVIKTASKTELKNIKPLPGTVIPK